MTEIHRPKQKFKNKSKCKCGQSAYLLEIFDHHPLSQSFSKNPKKVSKFNHQTKSTARTFDKSLNHQSRKLSKLNHQPKTIPQSLTTWQKQQGLTIKRRN